jgi:hypothetical protein
MSKLSHYIRQLKEKKDNADFLARCELIKVQFQAGGLVVKPKWWTDLKKIKLKKDKEYLRPEGMILINDIPTDKLINKLKSGNKDILKQRQLFHDKLDFMRTCKIVEHWTNGEKLIPPTIVWSSYYDTFEIENGRHRINAAICLGDTSVPIMTSIIERDIILQHLNLD